LISTVYFCGVVLIVKLKTKTKNLTPIAFVDDHEGLRTSIVKLLSLTNPSKYVFYEYNNGEDFVNRFPAQNYTPGLVIMDLSMPYMNGYEATTWLKQHYPSIPVLVLSDIVKADAIVLLVRCGANGYTSKQLINKDNHLANVIKQMLEGKEYFDDPAIHAFAKERMAMNQKELFEGVDSLSSIEMAIVRHLSLEKSINQKAREEFISQSAYKKRLGKVFKKLGLESSSSLLEYATSIGIIQRRQE
jgi:DNA-binding NarL/FixJ family response regulator